MPAQHLYVTAGEFARFAVVGIVSNAALFIVYLLVTRMGMGHKLAATLAYGLGVLQTFVFNRGWSFKHEGAAGPALGRYFAAYGAGYLLNMVALFVFVDSAGLPHQWVQGIVIVVLAALLFVLQKFWVFRKKREKR